ncbi:MAG TPA: hypothetical protein VKV26_23755 [Dehalococcoidia bacterium]|nr:hypothetical protein [Dehalococcoidia bacterium]
MHARRTAPGLARGSAFLADLHDCLLDLGVSNRRLLALALDAGGLATLQTAFDTFDGFIAPGLSARSPTLPLPWIRGAPDRLPIRPGSLAGLLVCGEFRDWPALRPVLDEAQRVLQPGGVLLAADAAAPGVLRQGHSRSAVAWCRVLEEHGFTVEMTLATRPAPPLADAVTVSLGRGEAVVSVTESPGLTRDRALGLHAWESLIVQARSS